MAAFNVLWNQGENILNTLTGYRNMSLVDFQQQVEALNSRLQRANRISPPYTTVDFVTTDFLDIDQTQTSATVRADAQAVTLKERSTTTNAVIQNQTFATSDGTAEAISTDNSLYRVSTTDGSIPTGTFTLQLAQSLNMTVLTFDLAAMPPTPTFAISASPDGTTFTPAVQVSMNGYRLTAWFAPMEMLYITLAITPAAPDTLGGTSYTFGLTDFAGTETEFEMVSELVTKPNLLHSGQCHVETGRSCDSRHSLLPQFQWRPLAGVCSWQHCSRTQYGYSFGHRCHSVGHVRRAGVWGLQLQHAEWHPRVRNDLLELDSSHRFVNRTSYSSCSSFEPDVCCARSHWSQQVWSDCGIDP